MKKLFLVLLILNSACEQIEQINDKSTQRHPLSQIKLIDTFDNQLELDTVSSITEATFHPMYIGEKLDSIYLAYNSRAVTNRTEEWNHYKRLDSSVLVISYYRKPDSSSIIVFVDTTQMIGSVQRYLIPPPPPPNSDSTFSWETKYYRGKTKSYLVMIENISEDTLNLGYGEYLPLIIEAQDSLGLWKPIQEPHTYFCGTGLTYFYITPNQIAITSCKLFKGNYKTKMRLGYGFKPRIYSNEFYGQMKYSQFDSNEF